ncbi:hypothetical protein D3C79_813430 [compost metagenome]
MGQGQVGLGLGEICLLLQCLLVSRNGLGKLEQAHVDIAQVKVRCGTVQAGKAGQRHRVVRRVIGRHTFPVPVAEMRGSLGEMALLKGPAPLLVRGEESIGQCPCAHRVGRRTECSHQQQSDPVHPPTAPQAQQRNQGQWPTQPIACVLPVHLLLIALHCLEVLLRVQRDPVQVVIVERQAAQWRVRRLRQVFQRLGIEGRLHGLAIIRSPRASLGIE